MNYRIQEFDVLIDDEDISLVTQYNWYTHRLRLKDSSGHYFYSHIYVNNKRTTIKLHRLIMGCTNCDGTIVDHINGNTLDNRKSNLRICNYLGNAQNAKKRKDNKTGYKGVTKRHLVSGDRYRAKIKVEGKLYNIGEADNIETCARWYDVMAIKYHGEFARLNFSKEEYTTEVCNKLFAEIEQYKKGMNRFNTSGYRGVSLVKKTGKYHAQIQVNGIKIHIGFFDDIVNAAKAYDRKVRKLFGDTSLTNFPEEAAQ